MSGTYNNSPAETEELTIVPTGPAAGGPEKRKNTCAMVRSCAPPASAGPVDHDHLQHHHPFAGVCVACIAGLEECLSPGCGTRCHPRS